MFFDDIISGERKTRIALITACGEKKNPQPMVAYKLYRSSRIRAVYNRRNGSDMYILSAEYGLVDAHKVIEPYDRVMDERRARELVPSVTEKLRNYEYVIFFKGGARSSYLSCVEEACRTLGKTLVTFGYAFMGGINDLPKIIAFIDQGFWEKILEIEHAKVHDF